MAEMQAREKTVLGGFKLKEVLPRTASAYVEISGLERLGSFDFSNARVHSATTEAREALRKYIIGRGAEIEKEMCEKNAGWFPVKVSQKESKTGASVQCSIFCLFEDEEEIRKMHGGECRKHSCTFWAPKSQLHQEGRKHYCPAWLVKNGLERTTERSSNRFKVRRIPVPPQVWPCGLKEAWIEAHLSQLPSEEEIARVAQEQERRWAEAKKEAERQAEEAHLEKERRKEEDRKEAARLQKLKEKRRAGMECKKNVKIEYKESVKKQVGRFERFVAEWYVAEDVDLYFSGQRVYIVFEDGQEIRKSRLNVRIIEPHPA
ncbi:MAG: hypothetical protein RBT25_11495 [Lentisphaeria bacterium]|uniref:hypothetical protein n=1 Tax=Desulfovibrio aminophilus TaxID=81425 RepID=UPI000482077A|nr:hypothetical protein [Desulfovibrio aminophilus]MDY0177499.1 hypothetical protein [Lentisphaeria bacterium]